MAESLPDSNGTGENGATFMPHVDSDGTLSWTNDKGLNNPEPVNIKGGDGEDGRDGTDGISPTVEVSKANGVTTVTITDADGTKTASVNDGTTPTKGVDYWTAEDRLAMKLELASEIVTQESGQSESLVMSQKAVTDLVTNAMGTGTGGTSTEYETVDSVEEMTDTSKTYVLSTTNTLWVYSEVEVGTVREQVFDPSNVFDGHMSGNSISSGNGQKIYRVPIDMSKIPAESDVYIDVIGLHTNESGITPKMMKIGYSTLASPAVGNSQFSSGAYLQTNTMGEGIISNTSEGCRIKFGYVAGQKISEYDSIQTILFEVSDTHDASTISAYLEYDGGTTSAWYDTETEPAAGGGNGGNGGNYVALQIKVDQNTSDIREVGNRVTALESGAGTTTVPTFWETAVNSAISKIKALQVGRNCVTFPFFSDNHTRNGYAGVLIRRVMDECRIPYCFFGGDSIDSGYIASEAVMVQQDKNFDATMSVIPNGRFCRAVGNHDGYWAVSASEKHYYSREQIYDLFLREEAIAQNKRYGGDGTYYYVDDLSSRVRFIILNTNPMRDAGGAITGSTFDGDQLAWLRDTALHFSETGWAVVFISHQPISNHYHANISNAAEVRTVVTESGVEVIGWFSGHIHRDRIYTGVAVNTTDDSQGESMGFTQVVITSDHTSISYDDATKHTVANDDQSHAIDFAVINRDTKTVNLVRLGIGNDRSYSY